ncbi:MAG: GntR family transcriptional regulator [Eubacteriaceae bacterium]|nr:GntR family transcriptional regulator [Eubacteriaceae bacterium]
MLNLDIKNHRPLREIVYEELKMQILKGQIVPGTRMMEVEMAEDMGVSRTPIREAIRKLEKEGLVTIEPRRGAYASQISQKDMIEILEVRQNMEGLAAFYAATRMSREGKQKMREAADGYDRAVKEGNTHDMIKYDTEFHHIIVEGADNKILVNMVEQLQELVLRFRYLYYDSFKRGEKMPAEHHLIMEGIVSGAADDARYAADIHIERLKEMIREDFVPAE